MDELTGNLSSPENVHRMRAHFCNLAKANHATVKYGGGSIFTNAGTDPVTREMRVPKINGPLTYAISMHELGHISEANGSLLRVNYATLFYKKTKWKTPWDHDLTLIEELSAWDWAISNSLVWTSQMGRVAKWAIGTYEKSRVIDKKAYDGFLSDPMNRMLYDTMDKIDRANWNQKKLVTRENAKEVWEEMQRRKSPYDMLRELLGDPELV